MSGNSADGKRSYRSPKRDAARVATRQKIVKAAQAVLTERGWKGFSLEAVARKAGVTRLTVYNQFGQRRALLEAVFDANARGAGLSEIGEAMGLADPHAALTRIVAVFAQFWGEGAAPMREVVAEAIADAEFAAALAARNERRRELLGTLVERMVARGEVAPDQAPGLTDTLFVLTGFAFHSELAASCLNADEVVATIADLAAAAVARARGPN